MKRKIIAVILALVSLVCWAAGIYGLFLRKDYDYEFMTDYEESELVPIEEFTGIYSGASLKDDCFITHGSTFRSSIDEIGPSKAFATGLLLAEIDSLNSDEPVEPEIQGIRPVDIRIIDVYGDKCTILFSYSGDQNYINDYPLSNLEYNETAVKLADDGIKNELGRYTIRRRSHHSLVMLQIRKTLRRFWIVVLLAACLPTIGTICVMAAGKKKRGDEQV